MLVLTRKVRESIIIGDQIEVRVLSVAGDKVQLGIQAPREIPVYRKEIYRELDQERAAARGSSRDEVDEALKRLSSGY